MLRGGLFFLKGELKAGAAQCAAQHKQTITYHAILDAKAQLIFRVWALNLHFDDGRARNDSQLDHRCGFGVLFFR